MRGRSYPIARINQACIQQLAIELEEEGKSNATINRIVSAVSTVLNHLAYDDLLDSAPKFRRRKEDEHRITWFSKEEVEAMATAAVDVFDREDLRDVLLFAAYTGLRMAEILTIKAGDIDLTGGLIHVGGRPGFKTKAANYRTVPIHERIRPMLSYRMESVGSSVRLFGDEWNDKDQLFRAFKKVRNLIGKGDEYVFHSLRHSFATWCVDAGVPIRVLMTVLGHKRIETTLRYAHTSAKASAAVLTI